MIKNQNFVGNKLNLVYSNVHETRTQQVFEQTLRYTYKLYRDTPRADSSAMCTLCLCLCICLFVVGSRIKAGSLWTWWYRSSSAARLTAYFRLGKLRPIAPRIPSYKYREACKYRTTSTGTKRATGICLPVVVVAEKLIKEIEK